MTCQSEKEMVPERRWVCEMVRDPSDLRKERVMEQEKTWVHWRVHWEKERR